MKVDGVIPPGTPIGRLGDIEWGWIVAAILFGWISTRAEQATAESIDTELTIRMSGLDPEPWDAGAVAAILPELAEMPGIDWSKPLGEWPRETMVAVLAHGHAADPQSHDRARHQRARDHQKSSASVIARQANAAAGGPLMTPDEINDEIDSKMTRHGLQPCQLVDRADQHRDQRRDRGGGSARRQRLPRPYLGASIVGNECLRRVQYDWWCTPAHSLRTREIFHRGHVFERLSTQHLVAAGFKFAPAEVLGFSAVDGLLRGHADGIIIAGPNLPGAYLNFPCVWEHKASNAKDWRAIERDGTREGVSAIRRASLALPGLSRHHQSRTVHRSSTPTRANGCTSSCRSMPSARRPGPIAPSPSSRQRAPASCCRASYRSRGLALPLVWPSRAMLGGAA